MRVLMVSQEFPPETGWGGIGTYLGVVAPALARAGADVHVLSVVDGQDRREREIDGVRVHRGPLRRPRGVGRALRLPLTWRRVSLAAAVAREAGRLGLDFDVCESPEWGAEGLFIALRGRVPVVVRLHSGASQVFPHIGAVGRDKRLAIRCEEALIRRADVVTGTRAQTSTVAGALGLDADRVRTITYPVARVAPLPPPDGPPRILFAGRFEARKGPDVLLRAMPRVLTTVPEARVVLLGADTGAADGGSYARGLRRLVGELGIQGSTEIVERWGRAAVAGQLARATACAVPSRWESFGYVAAEACALGRPVVASRIPALAGIVTDGTTGRLVPPDDAGALGDALAGLVSDPASAHRLGAAAARDVAERCDPDRVARLTLDAYDVAIRRRGRRRRPAAQTPTFSSAAASDTYARE